MTYKITTNGNNFVSGRITIEHPTTDADLLDFFTIDELHNNTDIQTALTNNAITITYFDVDVTDVNKIGTGYYRTYAELPAYPKPIIASPVDGATISSNSTSNIYILRLYGEFFTPDMTIEIDNTNYSVNTIRYIDMNNVEITFNSPVNNVGASSTIRVKTSSGLSDQSFTIVSTESTWVDLRSGGEPLSFGLLDTFDVHHRSGMIFNRDSEGMYFTGTINPWSSWVRFQKYKWQRADKKTLEIIYHGKGESAVMMGIGSNNAQGTSTAQYAQHEVLGFVNSPTNFWGLYGNNGTIGGTANFAFSTGINTSTTVYKLQFTDNGEVGGKFRLFALPSANESDWDDETNLVVEKTIVNMTADEVEIMPVLIPRGNTSAGRYLALRIV